MAPDNRVFPSMTAPPLVGREREQAILRDRLAAALAGHGSLVLIGGEAGIGKTALAESLCREATEQGALVLVGRCYDLTETPPYGPWVELLGRYHPIDGSPLGSMPALPTVFGERGLIGNITSQAVLFTQVQLFLAELGTRRPIVLLLDDLHWADAASLDLLRFLARTLATLPLLCIATYRADELTRRHPLYQLLPTLVREAHATRIDLRPLSDRDIAALVTDQYQLAEEETTRLVAYLHARSEGNPFFTGELLRMLEEELRIRREGNGYILGDLTHIRVPALLRQIIDGRLERLSDDAQSLLAVAAVIGQEVPLPLWATVAEATEDTVLSVIEEAALARLLEESPDGTRARFVHALIREALYEGIAPSRRRRLHQRAGEAIAALPSPDPDAVAYHFQQAGDTRAAEWLVNAGDRAQRLWAWPAAATRYEAALAILEQTDVTAGQRGWLLFRLGQVSKFYNAQRGIASLTEAARLAVAAEDPVLAANTAILRGNLRFLQHEIRQGLIEMEAGLTTLRSLSPTDRARMHTLAIPGMTDEERARGHLFHHLANTGRYAEADALSDRSSLPLSGRETTFSGFAYRGLAQIHASFGRPEEARQMYSLARERLVAEGNDLEAGLTALDELSNVALPYRADDLHERHHIAAESERFYRLSSDHNTRLPPQRGRLPLMIVEGDWAEARAVGLAVVAVGGHGAYLSRAQRALGPLAREQGDVHLARTLVHDMLPAGSATEPGDAPWFADAVVMQRLAAALATDAGDFEDARAWLVSHDAWLAWSGSVLGCAEGQIGWAVYYRAIGDPEVAYEYAMRAREHATEPRQPLALLAAHRLLGEFDTEAGRPDAAATHLDAALILADACGAPYERALTLLAQAELHATVSNSAATMTLLDEARAICIPLDAKPALAHAGAIAARLATTRTTTPTYPAGLSAREVEVLQLMATGKTNRDIANVLFLSEHTIRVHVRNILTKTDTGNRAAATAFALRHGIA